MGIIEQSGVPGNSNNASSSAASLSNKSLSMSKAASSIASKSMSHVMDESDHIEMSSLSKPKLKDSLTNSKVSNSLFYNRLGLDSVSDDNDSDSDDDCCAVNLNEVFNKKVKIKSTQ